MPVLHYRANRVLTKQIKDAARRDDRTVSAYTRHLVRGELEKQGIFAPRIPAGRPGKANTPDEPTEPAA